MPDITIPADLLPADGRFGSGPSKIRMAAVEALADTGSGYLGTSHRKEGVRSVVRRVREGLSRLFALPEGYEVVLGNGGATTFWDAAALGLIMEQSQHLCFGEFSSKFAAVVEGAPHIQDPQRIVSEPGTHPEATADPTVDVYALTQNETSTGVAAPIRRPERSSGLVAVDATSAAGGMRVDPEEYDVYYFAPQKCFASDGGLWLAICSPAAIGRIEQLSTTDRWQPPSISLATALDNSRRDQTYNTPALATLFLLAEQLDWMLDNGGLEWAARRCEASSSALYEWAESHKAAQPFVDDPASRSPVNVTIDFDDWIDAATIAAVLRENGILDTEPYRKLGRNQLRIACYPAIEPDDITALTRCVDHVIERLS